VDEGTPRLLLEVARGIGKTTVARRLVTLLLEGGVPVGGFTTAELRTGGRREGFVVEAVSGAQGVLAHVGLPGPPRVGKGGGFSDLEFALLVEAGLIGTNTVVATTVHPLQVLEEPLPETGHDFRLDLIVAGEEVIRCRRTRQPQGILWEHLDAAKVAAIPALTARTRQHGTFQPGDDKEGAQGGGSQATTRRGLHHRPSKPIDSPRFVVLTAGLVGVA
jgi:hypothetical protein